MLEFNSDIRDKADVLLFHEGNIGPDHQSHIQSQTPQMPIRFIDVSDEFSQDLVQTCKPGGYCYNTPLSDSFPPGYRHMCRFWTHAFLKYTEGYRYVMRVDEDCYVTNDFQLGAMISDMIKHEILYKTGILWGHDDPQVIVGMAQFMDDFVRVHKDEVTRTPVYDKNPYTNVALMDADFFRSSDLFKAFFKGVDETGCIYINRWGDLPIWGAALSCLVPSHAYNEDARIRYFHGSHTFAVNI